MAAPRLSGRIASDYTDSIDTDKFSRAAGVYIPTRKSASEIKAELDDMEMRLMLHLTLTVLL